MNRTWIHRAIGAAVLAGGILLLGASTANAGIPVAGDATPVTHVVSNRNVAHPIMARRDPATQPVSDRSATGTDAGFATRLLPFRTGSNAVFNESASQEALPGVTPSADQGPTNGTRVDGGALLSTAGRLVQPVSNVAGPAAGPLNGLTGGGEATTIPGLPLSAPHQVLRVSRGTESGFTLGQRNELPTGDLVGTVGQLVPGGIPVAQTMPAPVGGSTATEAASLNGLSSVADGTNIANLPIAAVTGPLTGKLGSVTTPEAASATTDGAPTAPAGNPAGGLTGAASNPTGALTGATGDPLGTVTGAVGGLTGLAG